MYGLAANLTEYITAIAPNNPINPNPILDQGLSLKNVNLFFFQK